MQNQQLANVFFPFSTIKEIYFFSCILNLGFSKRQKIITYNCQKLLLSIHLFYYINSYLLNICHKIYKILLMVVISTKQNKQLSHLLLQLLPNVRFKLQLNNIIRFTLLNIMFSSLCIQINFITYNNYNRIKNIFIQYKANVPNNHHFKTTIGTHNGGNISQIIHLSIMCLTKKFQFALSILIIDCIIQ
eukprot:TRINITY_DN606_c1_g1_i9.p1 TRINITY_DN606_c1_g1~~TRINITY_DN606_c1_g1_i9.p1  ORF type:complete len:189 (+),score=-32.65 TRINITY_DN606_c1_g1_i9:302-868(+)